MILTPIKNFKKRQLSDSPPNIEVGEENWDVVENELVKIEGEIEKKSDDGHGHLNASVFMDGFMSKEDKSKLDDVDSNANNYVHPDSHPASMITGLPTSLPANGGNADTVGGKSPSDFLSTTTTTSQNLRGALHIGQNESNSWKPFVSWRRFDGDDEFSYSSFATGSYLGNPVACLQLNRGSSVIARMELVEGNNIRVGTNVVYHTGNKPTSSDVGLTNVPNWAVSDSVTSTADAFATSRAVKTAYDLAKGKADIAHEHDDRYYTGSEVDSIAHTLPFKHRIPDALLDDVEDVGEYYVTRSDAPEAHGYLKVYISQNIYVYQEFTGTRSGNKWHRVKAETGWSEWQKVGIITNSLCDSVAQISSHHTPLGDGENVTTHDFINSLPLGTEMTLRNNSLSPHGGCITDTPTQYGLIKVMKTGTANYNHAIYLSNQSGQSDMYFYSSMEDGRGSGWCQVATTSKMELELLNGWDVVYGESLTVVKSGGIATITGFIANQSKPSGIVNIATLPPQYRPARSVSQFAFGLSQTHNGSQRVQVMTDGTLRLIDCIQDTNNIAINFSYSTRD